ARLVAHRARPRRARAAPRPAWHLRARRHPARRATGGVVTARPHVLLLDDATAVNELIAREPEAKLAWRVPAMPSVDELFACDDDVTFDLALVDLSFARTPRSGLDALCHLHETRPGTTLVILTQGDPWVIDQLRVAWEALPIATVLGKSSPLAALVEAV